MSTTPPRRARAPKRAAALTAAVTGAALLAFPGAASGQEIDCAALGPNPMRDSISTALDAAVACDTEVRIRLRAVPYRTVYATPEGRLHLVSTADAVQDHWDQGQADPTLAVEDGRLAQTLSQWRYSLAYEPSDAPLLTTRHVGFDWTGEIPMPTYSGTSAEYDELAPGLDLTADMDVASVGLTFTAADADAWDALAGGLTAAPLYWDPDRSVQADGGALTFVDLFAYDIDPEQATPFTVRDAAGRVTPAELAIDDAGALTISLPEGAVENAAFPIALSTQWTSRELQVSEWSAVTSAAPELAAFRGEAGLDAPYFEAAGETGTAVVGAYCDDFADPSCAVPSQGAAYWNIGWPELETPAMRPSMDYDFAFPLASAEFTLDAAAGTDCVAPDAQLVTGFGPDTTWANPAAPADLPAATGTCQDGTAAYDLTDTLRLAEDAHGRSAPITLAMTGSSQTARFDGGSARLDVYFDIVGTNLSRICAESPSAPDFQNTATPEYGGVMLEVWRPEDTGLGLTMTAAFTGTATGETVLTTDPQPINTGGGPESGTVDPEDALPDGAYEVVLTFATAESAHTFADVPCYLTVDTSDPVFYSNSVGGDTLYVDELFTIRFELADLGFPDGANRLTFSCTGDGCAGGTVELVDTTTVEYDLIAVSTDNTVQFQIEDAAGNTAVTEFSFPATYDHRDYDRDGYQDLVSIRRSDGRLVFAAGQGDFRFAPGVSKGGGWSSFDITMAGDLTSDGLPDLLARDNRTGTLYTYPGDGDGGFGTRITVGGGWNGIGTFTAAGDFNEDGKLDLLGVRRTDGRLYLYPGRGDGTFGAATPIGTGWNAMDTIATVGDVNLDGHYDLFAHDSRSGEYRVYFGDGHLGFPGGTTLPPTFDGEGTERFNQIAAAGDQGGSGREDLVAVDSETGQLVSLSLDTDGTSWGTGQAVAWPSGGARLPSITLDGTYEYTGDGRTDVLARSSANGTTYAYSGNGTGGFGPTVAVGSALANMNLLETAGDLDGDTRSDLLARTASGELFLYPGNGTGGLGTRISLGTGWNAFNALVGGQDFTGDGTADLLARETATGNVWIYPGIGDGTFYSRLEFGTGWSAMSLVTAVGDLDHDGKADLLARNDTDDCLYFYAGEGTWGVEDGVKIGCGWDVMNTVASIGDFDGDGHTDWVARHSNGNLYLYRGDGAGSYSSSGVIGTGWGGMDVIA